MKRSKLLGSTSFQRKGVATPVQKTIGEYMAANEAIPTSRFLGMPGVGRSDRVSKSEIMTQVARERGLKLIDVRLSPRSAMSDFVGKPTGIDELLAAVPSADPEVAAGYRKLVEERWQIGNYKIPTSMKEKTK